MYVDHLRSESPHSLSKSQPKHCPFICQPLVLVNYTQFNRRYIYGLSDYHPCFCHISCPSTISACSGGYRCRCCCCCCCRRLWPSQVHPTHQYFFRQPRKGIAPLQTHVVGTPSRHHPFTCQPVDSSRCNDCDGIGRCGRHLCGEMVCPVIPNPTSQPHSGAVQSSQLNNVD